MRRGLLCLASLLLPCALGFSQGLQPHTFVVESSSSLSFTGTASVPTPFGTVPVALTAGQPSYALSGTQRINLNTSLSLGELPGTDALVIPP